MLEEWIRKDIQKKKKSGTYLFYGEDSSRLKKAVLSFAKALCCVEEEDYYCDSCPVCRRIQKGVYADVHVLEDLDIESIREAESSFHESSYEGERKIFYFAKYSRFTKESANALLKSIEEPGENTFFLLWTTRKNILSTIRSRSIQVLFREQGIKLGVSKECYEFFEGNEQDILQCLEEKLDWKEHQSYKNIQKNIKEYMDTKQLSSKVKVYRSLIDFLEVKENISVAEVLWFVEELVNSPCERKDFARLFHYCLLQDRYQGKIEEKLLLSKMLNFPINNKVLFANLFLK
ncbi:DNA polymerase III subunit tau [Fusobacterium necrophorum subsp. necrophorum]|nr:DNA polymerase III subunit tau [Fusobacterium necrophorum subsp. necrophorum]